MPWQMLQQQCTLPKAGSSEENSKGLLTSLPQKGILAQGLARGGCPAHIHLSPFRPLAWCRNPLTLGS